MNPDLSHVWVTFLWTLLGTLYHGWELLGTLWVLLETLLVFLETLLVLLETPLELLGTLYCDLGHLGTPSRDWELLGTYLHGQSSGNQNWLS